MLWKKLGLQGDLLKKDMEDLGRLAGSCPEGFLAWNLLFYVATLQKGNSILYSKAN